MTKMVRHQLRRFFARLFAGNAEPLPGQRWPDPTAAVWLSSLVALSGIPPGSPLAAAEQQQVESPPLAAREAELLRRYVELERSFLRLADLLAATDPRRAAVLRDAFDRAREEEVGDRLGRIVLLLEEGQLLKAGASQAGAIDQFRRLLVLLEEGGGNRNLADTKQDVRLFLGRIAKLIARQRDIEGSTEAGGDAETLAARQREAADEAGTLASDLDQFARRIDESAPADRASDALDRAGDAVDGAGDPTGQPPEGPAADAPAGDDSGKAARDQAPPGAELPASPPADDQRHADDEPVEGDDEAARARRSRQGIESAERRMEAARKQLNDARRREARAEQEKAIEELETARAELEEILRQVREREVERLLVQLEARIRGLLRLERGIELALKQLAESEASSVRERQLESARIGREQEAVTTDVGKALALVRDDGSAVAIPEALLQVRDDSIQAADRLGASDLGAGTLGLVGDIVVGLEELLAALEKSRREEDAGAQAGSGGGRPAEPGEQPLVDKLAELKMLRSLQNRVNTRTERFARLLDAGAEAAAEPALIDALRRLAERQQAIERAARDIVAGRTE